MKYFNRLTTGAGKAGKTGRLFLENWLERLDFKMFQFRLEKLEK